MSLYKLSAGWLDIRPKEARSVILSTMGAFCLMAFVILARSLREASYLTAFDVRTLPYITVAAACLTLPTVTVFGGLLVRHSPRSVLRILVPVMGLGLAVIWAVALDSRIAVIVFYLWTVIGSLLLASGFWVLTAESFAVRGAKRLFGLIAAGGTAGAMATGLSLNELTRRFELIQLVPALMGLLILFFFVELLLHRVPQVAAKSTGVDEKRERGAEVRDHSSLSENLGVIRRTPYLKTIVFIVFAATVSSTLVDYQFKEFAQSSVGTGEHLAGFFGAVYGWAGGVALVIQLLVTARIMARAGIALGLAVLPVFLLFGSLGVLAIPALSLATVLRGGDYSVRKSLLRPMLEFLYVPVPAELRRRTKGFIDSFVDSAAEGAGAVSVFVWVTFLGMPSRYLSIIVIAASVLLLGLSRRMSGQYFDMIVRRLKEESELEGKDGPDLHATHLLTAGFSRMDIQSVMSRAEALAESNEADAGIAIGAASAAGTAGEAVAESDQKRQQVGPDTSAETLSGLRSPDGGVVLRALSVVECWDEEHISALVRLLVRRELRDRVEETLVRIGSPAVTELARVLRDDAGDFVIRRRTPRVLAAIGGEAAAKALFDGLSAGRFEIRYRAAIGLVRLMKRGMSGLVGGRESVVWNAVRSEVSSDRPIWEMQRLLDECDRDEEDELVLRRVGVRGELSLEHTFRLLTFVLDQEHIRAAFHGIILNDENLKSFALEYLEQALPGDIRDKLWLFIGDVSERQKSKGLRPMRQVVSDLMASRATLFRGEEELDALRKLLKNRDS